MSSYSPLPSPLQGGNSAEVTPAEFKLAWDKGERPVLIDVREEDEWDFVNLQEYSAILIPLSEFTSRLAEVPKDRDVVLQCRSGARSGQAQRFLEGQGYTRIRNLSGGILRWSDEVDSSKPKY